MQVMQQGAKPRVLLPKERFILTNPLNVPGGPALWIGFIASAILAVLQLAQGNGLIGQDVVDTIALALAPEKGGWLLPFILGAATKFFVTPAAEVGWSDEKEIP